jgi:hypothetical protein
MDYSNIFNTQFFLILGIILLLVSILFLYITQKINEQNHKMSSMLELVSTMAGEMNSMRSRFSIINSNTPFSYQNIGGNINNQNQSPDLIYVSDGDSESESEDIESESEDDEAESEESESDNDSNSQETKIVQIKTINITDDNYNFSYVGNSDKIEIIPSEEFINEGNESMTLSYSSSHEESSDDELEPIEILNDENKKNNSDLEFITSQIIEEEKEKENKNDDIINIKKIDLGIDMQNLEETKNIKNSNDLLDYKKLSLPKLRSIVVEKGYVTDSSKMKKNEILKLLGVE